MFRPVMQMSAPVKLRIGFVVQKISKKNGIYSSIVGDELSESAFDINLIADIEVLCAKEALAKISTFDGLFISGKHQENSSQVCPAVCDEDLHLLLQQAVKNKLPVLSTSNGFIEMNHALLNKTGSDEQLNSIGQVTNKSSLFVSPIRNDKLCFNHQSTCTNPSNKLTDQNILTVKFEPYGLLNKMFPGKPNQFIQLETGQHLYELSPLLVAEAYANNDSSQSIVAYSLANKKSFYLAVNWQLQKNKDKVFINQQLVKSFILACRKYSKLAHKNLDVVAELCD